MRPRACCSLVAQDMSSSLPSACSVEPTEAPSCSDKPCRWTFRHVFTDAVIWKRNQHWILDTVDIRKRSPMTRNDQDWPGMTRSDQECPGMREPATCPTPGTSLLHKLQMFLWLLGIHHSKFTFSYSHTDTLHCKIYSASWKPILIKFDTQWWIKCHY